MKNLYVYKEKKFGRIDSRWKIHKVAKIWIVHIMSLKKNLKLWATKITKRKLIGTFLSGKSKPIFERGAVASAEATFVKVIPTIY